MSEINAIATNNYILHNIDAKKLYVQEPLFTANSGDAVYVGWRPDETVLWSGANAGSTAFTVSEPLTNFEKVLITCTNNNTPQTVFANVQNSNYFDFGSVVWTNVNDGNPLQLCGGGYSASNGLDFTNVGGYQLYFAKNSSTIGGGGSKNIPIVKVIGINRKENA